MSGARVPLASFTSFGELLKYLRRRAQLSQTELSIAVDYSESQISRLENNLRSPDRASLLALFVPALGIEQVIITIADAPQAQLRRILSLCERIPVRAQMIPAMYELLQGKVSISELRAVLARRSVTPLSFRMFPKKRNPSRLMAPGAMPARQPLRRHAAP